MCIRDSVEDYLESSATFRFCEGQASAVYDNGVVMVAYRATPGEAMKLLGQIAGWCKNA